jgi:hypothetical protein
MVVIFINGNNSEKIACVVEPDYVKFKKNLKERI